MGARINQATLFHFWEDHTIHRLGSNSAPPTIPAAQAPSGAIVRAESQLTAVELRKYGEVKVTT